jgi:hypothetical protein
MLKTFMTGIAIIFSSQNTMASTATFDAVKKIASRHLGLSCSVSTPDLTGNLSQPIDVRVSSGLGTTVSVCVGNSCVNSSFKATTYLQLDNVDGATHLRMAYGQKSFWDIIPEIPIPFTEPSKPTYFNELRYATNAKGELTFLSLENKVKNTYRNIYCYKP